MKFPLTIALLLMSLRILRADEPDFSVTIVGSLQQADSPGSLFILLPVETSLAEALSKPQESPKLSQSFFVLVANQSKMPIRLVMLTSDWHSCLDFEIKTASGRTFQVHRGPSVWTMNAPAPWVFQPGGFKVFPVDFGSGGWQGLPSVQELPSGQPFKIKATFRFSHEKDGRLLNAESARTEAVSGRIPVPPTKSGN